MSRAGLFAYRASAIAASTAALVAASCGGSLEAANSDGGSAADGESDGYTVEDESSPEDSSLGEDAIINAPYGASPPFDAASPPADTAPPPIDASTVDATTEDTGAADAHERDVGLAVPYGLPPR